MISGAESSNTLAGLKLNVVADGFFHVVTWLLVMAGSIMTLVSWRKGRLAPSWSFHFGLLLAGWGIFNTLKVLLITNCSAFTTCAMTWAVHCPGTSAFLFVMVAALAHWRGY
jgi:uncharacterized membrane protein